MSASWQKSQCHLGAEDHQRIGFQLAIDLREIDDSARADFVAADLLAQAEHDPRAVPVLVTTSAPLLDAVEAELAELPAGDRKEMLESMGLAEPALATLTREAYKLLGLQSYFTMGPKEIRAWTVAVGEVSLPGSESPGVFTVLPLISS